MSTFDAMAYWKKKDEQKKNNSRKEAHKSSFSPKTTKSDEFDALTYWKKKDASKEFGLDTLQTDLTSLSKTIGNVLNGWQTKETMSNTLSSVQSMYDRLGKYQEYYKSYGGTDLSELQSSYKSVLDGWEDLSKQYGRYKSADEYTKAIKNTKDKLAEEEKMKTDDLGVVKTEIADMEKIYNKASEMTKNLSNQSLNVRSVSDAQRFKNTYDKNTKDREAYVKSMGYESYDALEKALGNKKTYLNRAEWIQKGIELASVGGEEFEEKSKYVAPEEKGFGIYRIDEEEERYKYINDEDYRLEYSGSVNDSTSAGMLTVGYEYMTDQEKKAYNYYYNSGDKEKAKEYLNTITESLGTRKAMADFEGYEGKTFKELAYGVNAGLNQFMSGMKNLINTSDEYIPVDATQQLSGMIRDDLNYEHGKLGTVPYDFITTTSNMLPSILTSSLIGKVNPGLGAKVGATLMGASASGNAYQEMLNLGYDKTQARVYSGLVGLSEAGLQSAIGGIGKLGGIGGKLSKAIKSVDNAFGRFAINYGSSIVAEGFEEAAQEVLNPIFQNIAAGYDTGAEVDWGEVVYSGLLGALSGGFWEGGPSVSQARAEVQAGKDIKSNERVSDLFDIANNPEIAEAYETYTRYANKGIKADNVSNAQLGRLYNEVKADAVETYNSKKSTQEQRDKAEQTLNDLKVYTQSSIGSMRAKDYDAEAIVNLIESGLESAEGTESYRLATEYKAKFDNYDALADIVNKKMDGETLTADETKLLSESKTKLSTKEISLLSDATDKAIRLEDTKDITTKLLEKGESEEMANLVSRIARGEILTKDEATKVFESEAAVSTINELDSFDNKTVELLNKAQTMDKETGALFVSLYDGRTDVTSYSNAFNLAVAKSENNFTVDDILKTKNVLSTEQINKIYSDIRIKADQNKKLEFQKLTEKTAKLKAYKGVINDSVIDYNNTSAKGKVNWKDLTDRQRKAVTFIKGLAQATGINLEFVANNPKFNGRYNETTNTLTINLDEKGFDVLKGIEESIIPTMSHELTHWMENKSPVLFRRISEIVFSTLERVDGLSESERIVKEINKALAKEYKETYEKENPGKTISLDKALKSVADDVRKEAYDDKHRIEVARSEIIARACEDMLSRSKVGKDMLNSLSETEQKTLKDKIMDIIQNIKDWIADVLGLYESASYEAQILKRFDEEMDKLSALWDEMFKESIEVNQALEKSGAFRNNSTNSSELFSVKNVDGKEVVWIEENILKNNKGEPTHQFIADFIAEHIGDVYTIIESGQKVYIGEDLPGEYTQSEYTQKVLEKNPNIIKVKNKATANIKEIIEIATNRKWEKAEHSENKDAKYGIYKYDTRFGFPIKDVKENVVGANVYKAKLVIRNASDGKKYLYDIISIKKDKVSSAWLSNKMTSPTKQVVGQKNNVSTNSILDSDKNVNTEISNNTIDGYAKAQEMQVEINQLTEKIRELEKSDEFGRVMDVLTKSIKNNDTENGIAQYNKWFEESGYSKAKERRDALQSERDKLMSDLHASYEQKVLDEEKQAIEKSGLSEADYFRKQAVKEFGYTPYFYDAGYITPNGKMLNFSGEKGQHYGTRGEDHRAIGRVYANVEGSKAMFKFMNEGNIRIMPESPGLDISSNVKPSTEQYATIRKFVREYANKEYFNIDITDTDGHTIGNYEYEGKISAERVVNDIKYFFENGTTREQSSISQFLYSEKDTDYLNAVESGDVETASRLVEEAAEKAFANSKVRDENGKLKLVYHGTVNEFTVFDRQFANIEGDFGKGYYFTSNEYDVDENYANEEGPDLKNKIDRYAERLEWDDNYSDLSYEERVEIARKKFITSEPNTITAYLNMENPVYITPDEKGTFLDFTTEYDEEYDEYGEPEGLFVDFIEALENSSSDYAYNNVDFNFLYEYAYDNGGMYASDVVKIIKERILDELSDENGDIATNEVIRLAFEGIGFDGIIDSSVYYKFNNMNGMDSSTTHYIVFNENQIKSADIATYDDNGNVIPLSQRFNTENDDIRYSEKDYSYETMIAKPDMNLTVMDENVPNNRADIIYKAKKKAAKIGKFNAKDKTVSVFVDDIGRDVLIGTDGLKHSMNRGKGLQDKPIGIVTLNAGQIIKNSIKINELTPSKESAKGSYVLIGASKDTNNNLYIVRFVVNEYSNELTSLDVLYAINTKKESAMLNASRYANDSLSVTDSTISIAELLDYVNKYFPDVLPESVLRHYGYDARPEGDLGEDALYSEKEQTPVYDLMGETERILKENEKLKADVERLNERLKIERKVTHGNVLNNNQLLNVAGHLRKISNSNIDKVNLARGLKDVYSFIATSPNLTWEEVFEKSYRVAKDILAEAKPVTITDDYSKQILNDIRNTRIRLSDVQKNEAQHIFGKNWNRNFFGRVIITDSGMPIDSKWSEWAEMYPDLFDATISDTDMLGELYDIIGTLQDASETVMEYNAEEQARWLANEIYNQYWNVSPVRTTADKYEKRIKQLNFEHRQTMAEFREKYNTRLNTRLKEQREADKEKYNNLINKIRERKNNEIAMAKQHGKDMMSKYKENAERKTVIQSILSTTTSLNKKLITNSKETHIPESLKPVVINLINAIDFSSKQLLGMDGTRKDRRGTPTKNDIALENRFGKVKSMEDDGVTLKQSIQDTLEMFQNAEKVANNTADGTMDLSLVSLDVDLIDSIKELITDIDILEKNYGSALTLQQMEFDHLKTLNATVKSISVWASNVDRALSSKHKARISQLGEETINENDALGERQQYFETIESLKQFFSWSNLLPVNAFKRLGNSAMKVFDFVRDAQDDLTFHQDEITTFTEELFKGHEVNKWREDIKEFKLNLPNGDTKKVRMPVSYIMTLYCVSKQEDAQRHLYGIDENGNQTDGGGMTIAPFQEKRSLKVSKDIDNTIMTEGLIKQITSTLTKEQKDIADKLQEFMNTKGSEWCDEVSMALYGIKKFDVENYFPITVTPTAIKVLNPQDKRQSIHFFSILNYGFTKSRNPNAKQSIEIGDVFEIFANHMSMAAIYSAYALPIYDMVRWYNYKGKDAKGKETGVIKSIQKAFGDSATTYIGRLISDLNGQHESSRLGFVTKIFKNTKLAMVGNSISVAVLQPTAYLKAMTQIPTRYLLKSLLYVKDFGVKKGVEKSKKYCGIALWKSKGNFDNDISVDIKTQMMHDEKWHEKLKEWSLWLAGKMDEKTWGMLWNACEFEVRDTRKDLKVGSEEFFETVAYKLRDVIYETQVVDSPLTRSDLMRSPDTGAKMITMFASEITVAYNIVHEALVDAILDVKRYGKEGSLKRNGKKIAMALTAYTLTSAVSQILYTAVQAFRDEDDEEKEFEDYLKMYLSNFVSDWLIVGKIPYIKEILNYAQGYSSSRPDTLWLDSMVKAKEYWGRAFDGKEGAGKKAIIESLKSMSYLSGIPMYNQYRDLMATMDKLGILTAEDFEEMLDDLLN